MELIFLIACERLKKVLSCRWVLEAMRLYLEMFFKNPKPIEHYSPFEIRKVLIKVLTVKDWGSSEQYDFFR